MFQGSFSAFNEAYWRYQGGLVRVWKFFSNCRLTSKDMYYYSFFFLDWTWVWWLGAVHIESLYSTFSLEVFKLPWGVSLFQQGFSFASHCHICKLDVESYIHLFIHCSYAKAIWDWMGFAFGVPIYMQLPRHSFWVIF